MPCIKKSEKSTQRKLCAFCHSVVAQGTDGIDSLLQPQDRLRCRHFIATEAEKQCTIFVVPLDTVARCQPLDIRCGSLPAAGAPGDPFGEIPVGHNATILVILLIKQKRDRLALKIDICTDLNVIPCLSCTVQPGNISMDLLQTHTRTAPSSSTVTVSTSPSNVMTCSRWLTLPQ